MISCFILLVVASASAKNFQAVVEVKHDAQEESVHAVRRVYHGEYKGKCKNDGFFYNDESSIVICSNGNSHIQPCADGSMNSARQGTSYTYKDLCDVNLVDDGYTLKHGSHVESRNVVPQSPEASHNVQDTVNVEPKVKYEDAMYEIRPITPNHCNRDGVFYYDETSILICSNGNMHILPCAPGSKNSARSNYQEDMSYAYRDFCDVNLVDDGYTLTHGTHSDTLQKSAAVPEAPIHREVVKPVEIHQSDLTSH